MTSAYLISKAALQPSMAAIQVSVVGVRFFGITKAVFRYLERLLSHQVTLKLLAKIRVAFYDAVEPVAPAGLLFQRSGDLLNRMVADVENLELVFSKIIQPIVVALFCFVFIFLAFSFIDLIIALILIVSLGVTAFLVPIIQKRFTRNLGKELTTLRTEIHTRTLDYLQGFSELTVLGQRERFSANLCQLNKEQALLERRFAK